MLAFLVRRLLQMVVTFFVLTYAVFFLTTPQGIALLHHLTPATLLPADYLIWLVHVLQGELGHSIRYGSSVTVALQATLPVTLMLVIPAFILQTVLSVCLGTWSGAHYRSPGDRLFAGFSFVFASIPQFWLALEVIIVICVQWNLFPFSGLTDTRLTSTVYGTADYWTFFHAHPLTTLLDLIRHLVVPVTLLALIGVAGDGQLVRAAIADALNQEYIRAARAHGLKRRAIIWGHALRNALVPLITNIGLQLPNLVFLAAMIEFIFNLPGLGDLFLRAAYNVPPRAQAVKGITAAPPPHDYQVITAYFLLLSLVALGSSLLADLGCALADPRIRLTGTSETQTAISPLWAVQPLGRIGNMTLTSGRLAVVALVMLIGTFGTLSVGNLLAPRPSLSSTWVGQMIVPNTLGTEQQWPVYAQWTETQHGILESATLSGPFWVCERDVLGNITELKMNASGTVSTNSIQVDAEASTGESFSFHGLLPANPQSLAFTGAYVPAQQTSIPGFNNGPNSLSLTLTRGALSHYQAQCSAKPGS